MSTISLKLPDQLLMRLESEARKAGVSKSELVRESLESFLGQRKKKPSCMDLASDLVGTAPGPKDLSTNPKYLDDYGK